VLVERPNPKLLERCEEARRLGVDLAKVRTSIAGPGCSHAERPALAEIGRFERAAADGIPKCPNLANRGARHLKSEGVRANINVEVVSTARCPGDVALLRYPAQDRCHDQAASFSMLSFGIATSGCKMVAGAVRQRHAALDYTSSTWYFSVGLAGFEPATS
jgi:hypothetical protein